MNSRDPAYRDCDGKAVTQCIWEIYLVALLALVITCSHIILAITSSNWSGIASIGAELASAIVFFIAKHSQVQDDNDDELGNVETISKQIGINIELKKK
ncbi:5455_t:CDS:2, partial [Funneliformis geosporum]